MNWMLLTSEGAGQRKVRPGTMHNVEAIRDSNAWTISYSIPIFSVVTRTGDPIGYYTDVPVAMKYK